MPKIRIVDTPWWCVEDCDKVKKAVKQHNQSIVKLDASFTGFQKQHRDSCSSVQTRWASMEAHCEQLSVNVQEYSDSLQQLCQEQTLQLDQLQLFDQVREERDRESAEFAELNGRLERLESKLDQSLSMAVNAETADDAEVTAKDVTLEGTLAMLVDLQGSLEKTQQAIVSACTESQSKAKHSPLSMPRVQRSGSFSGSRRNILCGFNGGEAIAPVRQRPSRQSSRAQPPCRPVEKTLEKALTRRKSAG
jgi:hypothetical protein